MTERPYDTKEGIATAIATYESLYALTLTRRAAAERGETLAQYAVLGGKIILRDDGFAAIFQSEVPDAVKAAPVMHMDDLHLAMRAADPDRRRGGYGWGGSFAPPHIACAQCGFHWTLETITDIHVSNQLSLHEEIDLAPYVGQTLQQASDFMSAVRGNALRTLSPQVQNARWANSSSRRDNALDEGWRYDNRRSDPRIDMSYVITEGDKGVVEAHYFHHPACHAEAEKQNEALERDQHAESFRELVLGCGFDDAEFERLPMPDHLMAAILDDQEEMSDEERAAAANEFVYLRVKTSLGDFAMLMFAYPGMDIAGSGVTYEELVTALGGNVADNPPMTGMESVVMIMDPQPLEALHRLMSKKKIAALTAAAAKPGDEG